MSTISHYFRFDLSIFPDTNRLACVQDVTSLHMDLKMNTIYIVNMHSVTMLTIFLKNYRKFTENLQKIHRKFDHNMCGIAAD